MKKILFVPILLLGMLMSSQLTAQSCTPAQVEACKKVCNEAKAKTANLPADSPEAKAIMQEAEAEITKICGSAAKTTSAQCGGAKATQVNTAKAQCGSAKAVQTKSAGTCGSAKAVQAKATKSQCGSAKTAQVKTVAETSSTTPSCDPKDCPPACRLLCAAVCGSAKTAKASSKDQVTQTEKAPKKVLAKMEQ